MALTLRPMRRFGGRSWCAVQRLVGFRIGVVCMLRRMLLTAGVLGGALALAGAPTNRAPAAAALTFFGWSDQHVTVEGDGQHLIPAIEAMNQLPGTPYPPAIGGVVRRPTFVIGCGDMTEWPSRAARDTYEELIAKRLQFPSYDVLGNHDEGGNRPSSTMSDWIRQRHGSLSYTYEAGGVRFVVLASKYDESRNNPAQPVTEEALAYLRRTFDTVGRQVPVVIAMHLCLDALTNRDAFVDALGVANVVLVLSGHYHKSGANTYRGRSFLQLPSPAPNGEPEVMVVRIEADRLVALPYNYAKREWVLDPRKSLDLPVPSQSQSGGRTNAVPVRRPAER